MNAPSCEDSFARTWRVDRKHITLLPGLPARVNPRGRPIIAVASRSASIGECQRASVRIATEIVSGVLSAASYIATKVRHSSASTCRSGSTQCGGIGW